MTGHADGLAARVRSRLPMVDRLGAVSSACSHLFGMELSSIPDLRVLTLNTWFRPPLDARIREMVAWIDEVDPHLVCLQEVERRTGR